MTKRQTEVIRTPTRKQIAMSRKEREQLRLVYIGLGVLAAIIVIVLGVGLWYTYVYEPNSPIAVVNGENISIRSYQTRVRYERFLLDQQIEQLSAQRESLLQSADQQLVDMLMGQFDQQLSQLQQARLYVDQQVLETMIQDKLVEAEAAKRGITVSDAEVTEQINQIVARQLNGLTSVAVSETATARVQASATAALWTPTPTFTPSPTLTVTQEITQPTATPVNTPTPAPTPTPNVIAPDALNAQYTTWLGVLSDKAGTDEASYRQIIRASLLTQKLQEAIGAEVPKSAEEAHARHILVNTEEEAKKVIERLQAGEDFVKLAAELSQDPGSKDNGGDLGWVPRRRFIEPIDEAIFTLPIGQISQPIKTDYGWHVVEVLGREERELSPSDYLLEQRLAFNDWLTNARKAATVEDFWSADKVPADPLLQGRQPLPLSTPGPQ